MTTAPVDCPCGGGAYASCCGPLHQGAPAPTAQALMRSRYSAYVLELPAYLAQTQRAPREPETDAERVKWLGLTVHQAGEEAATAWVEFTARFLARGRLCSLFERSEFERVDGRWRYTTGVPRRSETRVERNDKCPCGSGRKFKSCCG